VAFRAARDVGQMQFAALLGIPTSHIVSMKYKSSSSAYSYVWGNDVVLLRKAPTNPDGQDIATAYTFRWNGGDVGDSSSQGGMIVRSFFHPFRGARGGTQIIVTHNDAEQFVADFCSGLIISAHQ